MSVRIDEDLSIQLPADLVERLRLRPGDEVSFELGEDGRYNLIRATDPRSLNEGEDPWAIFDLRTDATAAVNFDISENIRQSREERTSAILGGGTSSEALPPL